MLNQPFFVPASIMLLLALPLVFDLIPPNRVYGVRTVKTLADKDLWYRVNRYAGWCLILSSIIYLGTAFLFPSVVAGETDLGRWVVHVVAFAGPLIISLLAIQNGLKRE
jgi:uncharacterized membrane protein